VIGSYDAVCSANPILSATADEELDHDRRGHDRAAGKWKNVHTVGELVFIRVVRDHPPPRLPNPQREGKARSPRSESQTTAPT